MCAQGREEEAQISLVAPEDVGPAEAEEVILPLPPDEPLVVDVSRWLRELLVIKRNHEVWVWRHRRVACADRGRGDGQGRRQCRAFVPGSR